MKKRVLSFTLALIIALTFAPLSTQTALTETEHGSNGKFLASIDPPVQGSIPISDRAGLEAIRNNPSGAFHLIDDIDLSGSEWVPIGARNAPFRGVIDGQGRIITGLTITQNHDPEFSGLIAVGAGEVRNLGIENLNISFQRTTFSERQLYIGGIVGASASYDGSSGGVNLINCYVTGNINVTVNGGVTVGGLAGFSGDSRRIEHSFASVNIEVESTSESYSYGGVFAGGIVGHNVGQIDQCYSRVQFCKLCESIAVGRAWIRL
jgi:hypothetical protein